MANGFNGSRSPVRAITGVRHLPGQSVVPRQRSWGERGVQELSTATPALPLAWEPALECPSCGSVLRLQLAEADGDSMFAMASGQRLRSAPPQGALPDFEASIEDHKRELLRRALDQNDAVMTRAAKALGLKYTTFVAMVHRLGLVNDDCGDTDD